MADILSITKIKSARKQHRSSWTGLPINIGEPYTHAVFVNDGYLYTWKSHPFEDDLVDAMKLRDCDDGDGITEDDFVTSVFEGYRDLFGGDGRVIFRHCLIALLDHYKISHNLTE